MSAAYAQATPAQPASKCRICGHAAAPRSKLCRQCTAAVKRARQVPTVMSQFMPVALSGYGSAGARAPQHQTVRFRNALPRTSSSKTTGWAALVAFAAFVVAVCVTAYFAAVEIDESPPPGAKVVVVPAGGTAPALVGASAGPPPPAPTDVDETATERAAVDEAAYGAMTQGRHQASPPHEAAHAPARRNAAADATANNASPTIPAGLSMTAADTNADTNPSTGAGAPLPPTPTAVPQEPVPPDRWQSMLEEIARCPRDNFFVGVVCEQRVRLRYCDGYWGRVSHCAGGSRLAGER
jgi:hypothetical protein